MERLLRFLNHAANIYTEERVTPECIAEMVIVTIYALNACSIDGTDINISVLAITRELNILWILIFDQCLILNTSQVNKGLNTCA